MDHNSFLVWWLLAVPIVLAVVDRMTMGPSKTSGTGSTGGYLARQNGRGAAEGTGALARPL